MEAMGNLSFSVRTLRREGPSCSCTDHLALAAPRGMPKVLQYAAVSVCHQQKVA